MSLNFSIDSILRHRNVESANSTLLTSGKLNQTSFLDDSTSAFLKKQLTSHQQLNNYLNSNGTSLTPLTTSGNGTNGLTNTNSNHHGLGLTEITPNSSASLLQSPLFYLNNKTTPTTNTTTALNLMDTLQTNGSSTINHHNTTTSTLAFELDQLQQLSHLSPLELSRLNPLAQFQLSEFQSQLVVPYLSKINSLYNGTALTNTNASINCSTSGRDIGSSTLTSSRDDVNSHERPNSNQFNNNSSHQLNSNNDHSQKVIDENDSRNVSKQAALFGLTNGTSCTFASNSAFRISTESQCSPLSDKSCEMILNYDDSSDSNRMSQHSGNNVSINSNSSSNPNKQLNSSNNNSFNNKDVPLCTKCKLHGIRNQVKGHKKNCPKKDCMCELCLLTDYGKRLRGKKSKKAAQAAAAAAATGLQRMPSSAALTPANLLMMESLNETNKLNNLANRTSLTDNNVTSLLSGASTSLNHQSTTPNSNSNSSCSSMSIPSSLVTSLRNHQSHQQQISTAVAATPPALPTGVSSSTTNPAILNQQFTNLHSGLEFLEKGAIRDYMKIVKILLKHHLAQDGLNYEQELNKLKYTVIYLLLNRFDKSELFNKFINDA